MKVYILDDWFDIFCGLLCFDKLSGYEVIVWIDYVEEVSEFVG